MMRWVGSGLAVMDGIQDAENQALDGENHEGLNGGREMMTVRPCGERDTALMS